MGCISHIGTTYILHILLIILFQYRIDIGYLHNEHNRSNVVKMRQICTRYIILIKIGLVNYSYKHQLLTFEQHNHVHNVNTNRHSISNLYRLHLYGIFTQVLDISAMDSTHRL